MPSVGIAHARSRAFARPERSCTIRLHLKVIARIHAAYYLLSCHAPLLSAPLARLKEKDDNKRQIFVNESADIPYLNMDGNIFLIFIIIIPFPPLPRKRAYPAQEAPELKIELGNAK